MSISPSISNDTLCFKKIFDSSYRSDDEYSDTDELICDLETLSSDLKCSQVLRIAEMSEEEFKNQFCWFHLSIENIKVGRYSLSNRNKISEILEKSMFNILINLHTDLFFYKHRIWYVVKKNRNCISSQIIPYIKVEKSLLPTLQKIKLNGIYLRIAKLFQSIMEVSFDEDQVLIANRKRQYLNDLVMVSKNQPINGIEWKKITESSFHCQNEMTGLQFFVD